MNTPTRTFEQRVLLMTWGVGLVLIPLKLLTLVDLTWPWVTSPFWAGTIFFLAWGLLQKAVTR